MAWIQSLAWELPFAVGVAKKEKKKNRKYKTNKYVALNSSDPSELYFVYNYRHAYLKATMEFLLWRSRNESN